MSKPLERSQSMTAYAQTFGDPDTETTSRLRKNLRQYVVERAASRARRRHWVQAGLVVGGLALVAGGLMWTQSKASSGAGVEGAAEEGVVSTGAHGQRIELAHGGRLELDPHTQIRILGDEVTGTSIELLGGVLGVEVEHPVQVQIDRYRVETEGGVLELRPTRGVPLVEVRVGAARVYGPDLPDSGVKVTPASP